MASRSSISFRKGGSAYRQRKKVAEGVARSNPGLSKSRKFAIATSAVKRSMAKRKR